MTLEVTVITRQWLFAIWKRIRDDSTQEPADRVEERLMRRAEELIDQPLKGPPEPFLGVLNGGHRYLYHLEVEIRPKMRSYFLATSKWYYCSDGTRSFIASLAQRYISRTSSTLSNTPPACADEADTFAQCPTPTS